MYVLLAGLNHRTAPVEVREKYAIPDSGMKKVYDYFKYAQGIEGTVILTTCNRMEIYVTTRDIDIATETLQAFLEEYSSTDYDVINQYIYQLNCYDAIEHLFRVASGLDSMILGEPQILTQVKDAYQRAVNIGASDGVLNVLFQRAIHVGKKVRTVTGIDTHSISVSYAAVELAREVFGTLEDKTVLVVGAGEMSELATRYLMQNGLKSVIVANRTYDRAVELAREFGGRAVRFESLPAELDQADIVISCTAANHYVIREEKCRPLLEVRKGRKIVMIDIAVPRDIDPALSNIEGVYLYDIDDLKNVVDENFMHRQRAAREAEKIIAGEIELFNEWMAGLYVVPVVAALKAKGEEIKEKELRKAVNRMGVLDEHQRKVLASMATSIVNQLLHQPIVILKDMAATDQGHLYAEVLKKLFVLDVNLEDQADYEDFEVGNKR